jgi:hypothetical protein
LKKDENWHIFQRFQACYLDSSNTIMDWPVLPNADGNLQEFGGGVDGDDLQLEQETGDETASLQIKRSRKMINFISGQQQNEWPE